MEQEVTHDWVRKGDEFIPLAAVAFVTKGTLVRREDTTRATTGAVALVLALVAIPVGFLWGPGLLVIAGFFLLALAFGLLFLSGPVHVPSASTVSVRSVAGDILVLQANDPAGVDALLKRLLDRVAAAQRPRGP